MSDLPDDLEELQKHAQFWVDAQKNCMWALADIALKAERLLGDGWPQVFPETASPGLLQRCLGVAKAYPRQEDRNPGCTYSQHMQVAGKANRKELLESFANQGLTTDESRKIANGPANSRRSWLLAIDVHFFACKHFFSGAGVETAQRVSEWIRRTVDRLKERGVTDAVMCFDSSSSFRKILTADWQDKYKDRPPKPHELTQQLHLVANLLEKDGFRCVSVDGFESDDIMASYAKQFDGRVTLMTADKDLRQVLSEKCNILIDVSWEQDDSTGDMLPVYKWLSAKQHLEETGIPPEKFQDVQAIQGDACDNIKGAIGVGAKGAADMIKQFGSLDAVLEAARAEHESIKPKKREALLQLAERVDIVRQLVTLRNDVTVPQDTRI